MSTTLTRPQLPLDPDQYRTDFPILGKPINGDRQLVYFDNASTTQRPRHVVDAMVDMYETHYANVHRGIHWLSDQATDRFENARTKVQALINARRPSEVIFTTGATGAINLVARSWGDANVNSNDEIILSELEHHSNLVPWHQLSERTGCVIKTLPIEDAGLLRVEALDDIITDRTKLIAVTAVSNVLGTIVPLKEIVRRARTAGIAVLVDAAQSVPHGPIDVQALDVDFLTFSGHKLMGPTGVGILYGKEALLEAMPPFLGGGSMIRRVKMDSYEPADLPTKFEAGTPPIVPAVGLGAAIDYLNQVDTEKILAYEQALCQYAHQVLDKVEGIQILGPEPNQKAGIVCFTLDGIHAHDVAQLLDRHGIAIRAGHHCAMPLHKRLKVTSTNRASFYFYNTLDEIDQLAVGLRDIKRIFRRN